MAKQTIRSVLSDSRQLLKFALLSLIESLRADPIKFNFLIHGMPSPLAMSKSTIIDHAGTTCQVTSVFLSLSLWTAHKARAYLRICTAILYEIAISLLCCRSSLYGNIILLLCLLYLNLGRL